MTTMACSHGSAPISPQGRDHHAQHPPLPLTAPAASRPSDRPAPPLRAGVRTGRRRGGHSRGPRTRHAARRLDHRLARLLAGRAVEPPPERRPHGHRLRRHPRPAGLRAWRTTATTRATAASPGHQRRRPEPAARPGWPRPFRTSLLMHFGTNDVWSNIARRPHPRRVHQAGRPDAGLQPRHADPRRADHPHEPRQLRRAARQRVVAFNARDPRLGARRRAPPARR